MNLKQNIIHSKNNSRKFNQLKNFYVTNLTNNKKNSKNYSREQRIAKRIQPTQQNDIATG